MRGLGECERGLTLHRTKPHGWGWACRRWSRVRVSGNGSTAGQALGGARKSSDVPCAGENIRARRKPFNEGQSIDYVIASSQTRPLRGWDGYLPNIRSTGSTFSSMTGFVRRRLRADAAPADARPGHRPICLRGSPTMGEIASSLTLGCFTMHWRPPIGWRANPDVETTDLEEGAPVAGHCNRGFSGGRGWADAVPTPSSTDPFGTVGSL